MVVVAHDLPTPFSADFSYHRVPLKDEQSAPLAAHLEAACAFVSTALAGGGAVLVHCFAGRSRSVAVVVAYLVAHGGLSLDAALAKVVAVRPHAAPNDGFMAALRKWERTKAAWTTRSPSRSPGRSGAERRARAAAAVGAAAQQAAAQQAAAAADLLQLGRA